MQSALELFARRGYHGASVSMIAKNAGVSTGLMYNYFKSKTDLLEAIVKHGVMTIGEYMGDIESIEDPQERIAEMVEKTFQIALEDMPFWSLYFNVMMQPDLPEGAQRSFSEFIQSMFTGLEMMFAEAGMPDPEAEAKIFGAILDGVLLHYMFIGKDYPLENVKKLIIEKYSDRQSPK